MSEFDDDDFYYEEDVPFLPHLEVTEIIPEPVWTGLYDSKGNYIIRHPVKKPEIGFLSKDSFNYVHSECYIYGTEPNQED